MQVKLDAIVKKSYLGNDTSTSEFWLRRPWNLMKSKVSFNSKSTKESCRHVWLLIIIVPIVLGDSDEA